jgi:DNA topoisomerase I
VPRGVNPETLSLEEAIKLVDARAEAGPSKGKGRKGKASAKGKAKAAAEDAKPAKKATASENKPARGKAAAKPKSGGPKPGGAKVKAPSRTTAEAEGEA